MSNVDITSTTVFGAKYVELVPPEGPLSQKLRGGTGDSGPTRHHRDQHRLPAARHGAGQDRPRETQRDPRRGRNGVQRPRREDRPNSRRTSTRSWPRSIRACRTWPMTSRRRSRRSPPTAMRRPISSATLDNSIRLSNSIVEEQQHLDEFLISSIGLADIGNDVIGGNRQALTDLLRVLVPTTSLLGAVPRDSWAAASAASSRSSNAANYSVFAHPVQCRPHAGGRALSLARGPAQSRGFDRRPVLLQGVGSARRPT